MEPKQVTHLLQRARQGEPGALDDLLPVVYGELREIANGYFRRQRVAHTLQPTALVHEAYLKVIDQKKVAWEDRAHFFAIAAKIMRQVLVDHARRRNAQKRGGNWLRVTLEKAATSDDSDIDVMALDEALAKLAALDERKSRIVELRFFGGLTVDEVAHELAVSKRTVESD